MAIYEAYQWNTGEAITQARMRNIENGIAQESRINDEQNTTLANLGQQITAAANNASEALAAVNSSTISQAINQASQAWSQIKPLVDEESQATSALSELINGIIQTNTTQTINITNLQNEINRAKKEYNTSSGSLLDKINAIDNAIATNAAAVSDVNTYFIQASSTFNTVADRLADMDTRFSRINSELNGAHASTIWGSNQDLSFDTVDARFEYNEDKIKNISTELSNAHSSTALAANGVNKTYTDIDARFEAIESELVAGSDMSTRIDTLASNISDLSNNKVDKAAIANNLTTETTGKVLDAYQGYVLNTGKINYADIKKELTYATDDDTVLQARQGKLLKDAIDSINSELDTATTGVKARISALEAEVDMASADGSRRIDLVEGRLDALDNTQTGAIKEINDKILYIADELNMLDDQDAMKNTNTRVDALDAHVTSLATELGMIQNGEIVDTNTRVDSLESRMDAVDGISGALATLDSRLDTAENDIDTLESDLNTAETGLKARMTAAESRLTATESKANAAATASDLSNLADRVSSLENEPKSATTIIPEDRITYDSETGAPTIYTTSAKTVPITPSADVDYLLAKDNKYYYWKYIDSEWELISGGGGSGTGNTSGYDLTAVEYASLVNDELYAENTDYYVTRTDGVHHYRYVMLFNSDTNQEELTEIEIGQIIDTNNIKKYNMMRVDTTRLNTETNEEEEVSYLNLYEFDYGVDNTIIDDQSSSIHLRAQIELPKGGGGGSATSGTNKLVRIGDQTVQKITGSTILLRAFYSSWDSDGVESSAGEYTLKTGNTVVESGIIPSGAFNETISGWKENTAGYKEFDVTDYCKTGSTTFTLTVTVNNVNLGKSWTVNIIDLHLESTAPDTLLINTEDGYDFPYTPFGALNKTLHVIIDDDTLHESTVSLIAATSGRLNSFTIPAQSHGAHKIEMYLTALIGGVEQRTDSIIREYIWYDVNDETTPIILASPYNEQTITATQYSTIEIPYQVYKKGATSIDVYYYLDNEQTAFDKVTLEDVNTGTLAYLATDSGSHSLTIKVDNVSITINLVITQLTINVAPVSGAIIDFDPTTLTNSSVNRLPSWTTTNGTYHLTASDNFNWSDDISGGGYKEDEDGKCFVIKAGSYVDLDYPMFQRTNGQTVLDRGSEMKIIFKTAAVRDIEAVWFNNTGLLTEKTVGIQLGTHYGWLKTDKATDTTSTTAGTEYDKWVELTSYNVDDIVVIKTTIYRCLVAHTSVAASLKDSDEDAWDDYLADNWLKIGQIDTEVLATNSYLYFPYSEEDKIELDININAYNANEDNNFIMSYEDGVPSKAYAYSYGASGDGLHHSNTIRIGSPDCDVYIYHLRIYNKSLDTEDILQNFIADGKDIDEKVDRYNRNCVYWDSTQEQYFTSPSATAVLDPIKLAERIPNVKVLMLDTPIFTVGKKNFVQGSSLRCIQADGGDVYPSRGDADNWFFQNGFHAGQGTTSDNYGQSSRNVDFLFIADENKHYPTKKKNMNGYDPNKEDYVSSVLIGKEASEWVEDPTTHIYHWTAAAGAEPENCVDWKGDTCKVSLTESSVPNNYFNLKVNVASSENVNNALFQKRYNDFLVYASPAQAAQIIKHGAAYRSMGLDTSKVKVKNGMEFVPAVLFIRENDPDTTKHTEFKDCEWHFYALGNIGDSKKTDYTRAYDPDDMNEFTCENSDNNTNNGQFQSGVFTYQGRRAIETPYSAYDSTATYAEGAIVVNNGNIQIYNGSSWTNATLTNWTDGTAPYFAPYTAPNPMQYLYPITSSEWNVQVNNNYVNYKHNTLVTEKFDGDHSFEFRYACCGDYRDGDLINDTTGTADAQFNLNHDVMLAFYEWLITATDEQYEAEAEQWFIPSAMEFFYAFTHYYTMMDNRAKNTFWHYAKTGVRHAVPIGRAYPALLHIYEESNGQGGYQPATAPFDNTKQYYTQYAFDLWVYDTDTALGIDNNGALVFPYGKEDTDYRTEGDASSGYAFNGAGSIFWRRLRTTYADDIAEVMNNTDANCFNAEDLIQEFDQFQNCFPEEIWRLDIERKYIRTFTGDSVDNSVQTGKQNPRFLTSMMQGRKKYQRRQWIRNQSVYFNSKYRLTDIIANGNTIEFNCTTPADIENIAVTPSYRLKLIPYQDMYLNVQVGNGNYKDSYITAGEPTLRAKAGTEYTFDLSGNYQETRIYINGANHLSGIGNLAPMYPYSFDLRALAHIKTLDIGTDEAGYVNTKFTELKLPNYAPLLETLNIKNCHSIGGTINLSQANNIRTIEAVGTSITGVSLPDYTSIETLHLPSSVRAISLYGARALDDFQMINSIGELDYSGLYTLHVYDSDYSENVNWIDIAVEMLEKESLETNLLLSRLSTATIEDIQTIEPFKELKSDVEDAGGQITLDGTIHVTGSWSTVEIDTYENTWPGLTFDVSEGTQEYKTKVVYKTRGYQSDTAWVPEQEIETRYITAGQPIPDIYTGTAVANLPHRDATIASVYQFGNIVQGSYVTYSGWTLNKDGSNPASLYSQGWTANNPYRAVANVQEVVLYTFFNESPHQYTVNWYLKPNQLVKSVANQSYGGGDTLEAPTVKEIRALYDTATVQFNPDNTVTYSIFDGWEKLPINIDPTLEEAETSNYNIYAKWYTNTVTIDESASNGLFADTSTPTLEQLLVFSRMDNTNRNNHPKSQTIVKQKKFNYQMGFNGTKDTGTVIVNTNNVQTFNESNAGNGIQYTDIVPFDSNHGFTIAIDYQFDANQTISTDAGVLVGCYDRVNGSVVGFALYNNMNSNHGPTGAVVGYGNMFSSENNTTAVGNLNQRNIIVLRHPANTSELWVYSSKSSNGNSLEATITSDRIELSTQTLSSNATLCLGHLRSDININSTFSNNEGINTMGAQGTVYWAKYWNEDLGAGECKQLAAWPHENMTSIITSVTESTHEENNNIRPSIYLTGLTNSSHGLISSTRFPTTTGSVEGWGTSLAKNICDNRIFIALPIRLQSILANLRIGYLNYQAVRNTLTESVEYSLSNIQTSLGYVYLPSISSLNENTTDYNNESIYERNGKTNGDLSYEITPYTWYGDTISMEVYDYNYSSETRWQAATANNAYYNLRFFNKPIRWGSSSDNRMRVFRVSRSTIGNQSLRTAISRLSELRPYDIAIIDGEAAYMYVTTADLNTGLQAEPQGTTTSLFNTEVNANTEGGWIKSHSYITRSANAANGQYNNFIYINALGSTITPDSSQNQPGILSLDYAFTI